MRKAFTLVEVLVTISLLGVLIGIVLVVLNPSFFRAKARDGRRVSDLQVVQGAIEMYYAQQNGYPSGDDAAALNTVLSGGGAWTAGGVTYLSRTPKDPTDGTDTPYCYCVPGDTGCGLSSGAGYLLCAEMEGSDSSWTSGDCNSHTYDYCRQNTY